MVYTESWGARVPLHDPKVSKMVHNLPMWDTIFNIDTADKLKRKEIRSESGADRGILVGGGA